MDLLEVLVFACAKNGLSRSHAEIYSIVTALPASMPAERALESAARQLGLDMLRITAPGDLELGRDAIVLLDGGGFGYLQRTGTADAEYDLFTSSDEIAESLTHEACSNAPFRRIYCLEVLSDELTTDTLAAADSINQWMIRGVLQNRGMLVQIIFASLLANLLAVAISLYSLQIYDRVLPNQSYETLAVLSIGALLAIVVEGSIRIVRSLVVDKLGLAVERATAPGILQAVLAARLSDRRASPSNMVNLTRELNSIRELFTTTATSVVADIPFVFIFVGLIYVIGGSVAYVILGAAFCIILFSLITRPIITRLSEDLLKGNSNGARVVNEVAYGMETVKAVGAELLFIRRWREVLDFNLNRTSKFRAVSGAIGTIAASIQQLAYVCVMAYGSIKVFNGEFTAGTLIAMSILTSRTLAPVTQFSNAITRWEQMKAGVKSIDLLLSARQERPKGRSFIAHKSFTGRIALRNVAFGYPGSKTAQFKCEALDIKAHEHIALLGRNGSGKSALLKILSGHFDFESGQLLFDDIDFLSIDPDHRRNAVGYLGQDVRLFLGTVRENLCFGQTKWTDDELLNALEFAGAVELVKDGSGGLDRLVQDGGEGLSGGQKQALAMARLFLRDPKIVLLDEPSSALDQMAEGAMINMLKSWLAKRTVVIATHRLGLLDLVDRILVIQNGAILMDGPKAEVLNKLRSDPQRASE